LEQLGISLSYLISHLVNFALLAALLYMVLYKPVLSLLRQRQERIARSMADVEAARASAAQAQQEYDRRLAEAQRKAQEIIGQAAQSAEKVAADIRAAAQREAEEIRQRARQEAAEERSRVMTDVQSQIASLSVLTAERVLGRAMDDAMQRQLIEQSLHELSAVQLDERPENSGTPPRDGLL
jgi:F-type H+-transporting ATPase subunit b